MGWAKGWIEVCNGAIYCGFTHSFGNDPHGFRVLVEWGRVEWGGHGSDIGTQ